MPRILIAGVGAIGRGLAKRLAYLGHEVIAFTDKPAQSTTPLKGIAVLPPSGLASLSELHQVSAEFFPGFNSSTTFKTMSATGDLLKKETAPTLRIMALRELDDRLKYLSPSSHAKVEQRSGNGGIVSYKQTIHGIEVGFHDRTYGLYDHCVAADGAKSYIRQGVLAKNDLTITDLHTTKISWLCDVKEHHYDATIQVLGNAGVLNIMPDLATNTLYCELIVPHDLVTREDLHNWVAMEVLPYYHCNQDVLLPLLEGSAEHVTMQKMQCAANPTLVKGPIAFVGGAAGPCPDSLWQPIAKAATDAVDLVNCFTNYSNPNDALTAYNSNRYSQVEATMQLSKLVVDTYDVTQCNGSIGADLRRSAIQTEGSHTVKALQELEGLSAAATATCKTTPTLSR